MQLLVVLMLRWWNPSTGSLPSAFDSSTQAEVYGFGLSEEFLGEFMKQVRFG